MLQFPPWKIAIVLIVLLGGMLLALPNLFADTTLGIAPNAPDDDSRDARLRYEQEIAAAEAANWPGVLPNGKLNLGLDLRGGVYLLIELAEDDVKRNRLTGLAADARSAFTQQRPFVNLRSLPILTDDFVRLELRRASDMDEAMNRLQRINAPVASPTGGFGSRVFSIEAINEDTIEARLAPGQLAGLVERARDNTIEVVRRRIDPTGTSEISIQPSQTSRLILEAPGEPDPQRLKDILSRAGNMTFNLVNSNQSDIQIARAGRPPAGFKLVKELGTEIEYLINETPIVTGADIVSASPGFDESNSPQVNFTLNGQGARDFGQATANNRGQLFAIVLDDQVMSAPRINQPIYTGSVRITGNFTLEEAEDLATIIEAGELPAKLQFINERTVGPTLGEASIRAGTTASLIGLALVGIFMVIAYGLLGGFAVASLVFNIVLIIGALSGLGATLTLPGIAGIVLTIGMAVDANVLVFERIREEKRAGRSPMTAVQAGYERALSTILDANITTFIAAAILYALGSGPVKGFAVTLGIGIITSVFTAFVVTRWFTVIWLKTARPKTLAV